MVVEVVVGSFVVVVEVVVGAFVVVVEVVVGSFVVVVEVVVGSFVVVVEVVVGSFVVVVEVVVGAFVVVVEVVVGAFVVVVEIVVGAFVVVVEVVVVVDVVVVVVVVVVVLSPLPVPEPLSNLVKAVIERGLVKFVADQSNKLLTLVPAGSSEANSVVYSIYIAQFQLSPKLMVKPVIFPSAFRVNSAFLVKLSIGSNLRSAASLGIFFG